MARTAVRTCQISITCLQETLPVCESDVNQTYCKKPPWAGKLTGAEGHRVAVREGLGSPDLLRLRSEDRDTGPPGIPWQRPVCAGCNCVLTSSWGSHCDPTPRHVHPNPAASHGLHQASRKARVLCFNSFTVWGSRSQPQAYRETSVKSWVGALQCLGRREGMTATPPPEAPAWPEVTSAGHASGKGSLSHSRQT